MNRKDRRKDKDETPAWAEPFLAALRAGMGVRAAAREVGVTSSTPYHLRRRNVPFRKAWEKIQPVDDRRKRKAGPRALRQAARLTRFLEELARTSNVAAAAEAAEVGLGRVYRLRREDPDFARRWYAALAEGYDNLEMELLHRLRSGESADRQKFDTATALRCLTAHRENVAREKARRRLAEEVTTIAAINAKIDAMRAHAKQSDAAVRKARQARSAQAKKAAGSHDA